MAGRAFATREHRVTRLSARPPAVMGRSAIWDSWRLEDKRSAYRAAVLRWFAGSRAGAGRASRNWPYAPTGTSGPFSCAIPVGAGQARYPTCAVFSERARTSLVTSEVGGRIDTAERRRLHSRQDPSPSTCQRRKSLGCDARIPA